MLQKVDAATIGIVADRLELFLEIESIGSALTLLEQRFGTFADLEDVRRRQQVVRSVVLEQLRCLLMLAADTEQMMH